MTNAQKRRFVSLWQKEYDATVEIHRLQSRIESAQMFGGPTGSLVSRVKRLEKKRDKACHDIITMIEQGIADENTPENCKEELGHLHGYVGDCYCAIYADCVTTP